MYRPAPRPLTLVFPTRANEANYLIDNKVGIILDADGTRANRKEEIAITQTMVERVERRFDLRPKRLVDDTVYCLARLLKWLVDRKITPHVPVWDKSARHDGIFSRADFVFDQERNVYICPGGAELTSTGNIDRFAHMKRILKLDRLRLRGLSGAKDAVLLTATAQNLRRLAKLLCRSPPPVAAVCFA